MGSGSTYIETISTEQTEEDIEETAKAIAEINQRNAQIAKQREEQFAKEQALAEKQREAQLKADKEAIMNQRLQAEQARKQEHDARIEQALMEEKAQAEKKQKFKLPAFGKKKKPVNSKNPETTTDSTESEELLKLKAELYKDELTGLYNDKKRKEDIQHLKFNQNTCVFSIDANNLKYTNDTFGHEKGDLLLKEIANALLHIFDSQMIYHVHGDEYVAILENTDLKTILTLEERFMAYLDGREKRLSKSSKNLLLSAAIGHAMYIKGDTFKDTYTRADLDMQTNKIAYKKAHPEYDMRGEVNAEVPVIDSPKEVSAPKDKTLPLSLKSEKTKKEKSVKPTKPEKLEKTKKSDISGGKYPTRHVSYPDEAEEALDYFPGQYQETELGEMEVAVPGAEKEFVDWRDSVAKSREKATANEFGAMIEEIQHYRDKLIVLALVTDDMKNLVLLRNTDDFFAFCERQDYNITLSYIYVLYKDNAKYYMKKPQDIYLESIFNNIKDLFMTKTMVTGRMIAELPNMAIFENIYVS